MLYEKLITKVDTLDHLLEQLPLTILYSETLSDAGRMMYSNGEAVIFLRSDLSVERENFVLLHEIGHYLFDVNRGVYSFHAEYNAKRSEFQANLYACLCLLTNQNVNELNIPLFLVNKGCPEIIAQRCYEYLEMSRMR